MIVLDIHFYFSHVLRITGVGEWAVCLERRGISQKLTIC